MIASNNLEDLMIKTCLAMISIIHMIGIEAIKSSNKAVNSINNKAFLLKAPISAHT
jgi:hypothetical protein